MTLCIAAICRDKGEYRMVVSADSRSEVGWASGDVALKVHWATKGWIALFSGDESKADDLLSTLWPELKKTELNVLNITDRLHEAVAVYKAKLCDRYIRAKLGVSFERFLKAGASEVTQERRNQLFQELGNLHFNCDVLALGFIKDFPLCFLIDKDGDVARYKNFAAIGSGALIAEATLFQREQIGSDELSRTLYNVYEATRMGQIAPGVGKTKTFLVLGPPADVGTDAIPTILEVSRNSLKILERTYKKVGPRRLVQPPDLGLDC